MIKILHAADFHLDSPLASLSDRKAVRRRGELRLAVKAMVELSLEEEVDIILLSGDLFDSDAPFGGTGKMLAEELGRAGAKVFIAPGNHDYYSPTSPYALEKWPENVHIFTKNTIEKVELPQLETTVYGAAFTAQTCLQSNLAGFTAEGSGINVMALHAAIGTAEERYNPVTTEQIAASGIDYLALGHTHDYSGPRTAGKTVYAYSGCIEGRGFDETGDKGVIIAEVEKGRASLRFVPMSMRRYHRRELDVTGADISAILENEITCAEDIYRIYLTGSAEQPDIPALMARFENKAYHIEIHDRTSPARNLWDRAGENSLRGVYLEKLRAAMETDDKAAAQNAALAAKFAAAALDGLERPGGGVK
ncbi:MAG: DNA repair exonuclease [Oscillospiraceae bacterium]|nr:DNA repair exonuclease [Oscillospiraceae bacterium]